MVGLLLNGTHIVRAVYEYENDLPVVVTVYYPLAKRYFRGGGTHADKKLMQIKYSPDADVLIIKLREGEVGRFYRHSGRAYSSSR